MDSLSLHAIDEFESRLPHRGRVDFPPACFGPLLCVTLDVLVVAPNRSPPPLVQIPKPFGPSIPSPSPPGPGLSMGLPGCPPQVRAVYPLRKLDLHLVPKLPVVVRQVAINPTVLANGEILRVPISGKVGEADGY